LHPLLDFKTMDDKHKFFFTKVFELYNKYGIKSVTMDDVSHELGISKKTLYECIRDKSELVKHVMQMVFQIHSEKMNEISGLGFNAIEELIEVNRLMTAMVKDLNQTLLYDLKKYYPEFHQDMMKEQFSKMHEGIRENLIKGQKEGLYRKDMKADIISRLHMTRIRYSFAHDSFMIDPTVSDEVNHEILTYHLHGIATEKGIGIFNEIINQQSI
jgi:AcrR family transcriptional regulator